MELKLILPLTRSNFRNLVNRGNFYINNNCAFFSSATDVYLENLVHKEGSKCEINLLKYIDLIHKHPFRHTALSTSSQVKPEPLSEKSSIPDIVRYIELQIQGEHNVPNNKLHYFLVCFSKSGNINGVKAVQIIVKKCNILHFNSHSEYKHYLAEAFWIKGKIEESLKLFSDAYQNPNTQPKVKVMLTSLFPLLVGRQSEALVHKTVNFIKTFSVEKGDSILLACLWRELFRSEWYTDQQLAKQILEDNNYVLDVIKWMIPAMGKDFLQEHRVDDFYRLLHLTLENKFTKYAETLLRLLFDYHYVHQNIGMCSQVVKYSSSFNYCLTEEQQARYVRLLLKSKNAVSSKLIIKKPQRLDFKF